MRSRSRLTARINLVLGVIVVLVGVNATLAIRAIHARDQQRNVSTALRSASNEANDLAQAATDQEISEREFLITGKDLGPYRKAEAEVAGAEHTLMGLAGSDPGIRQALAATDRSLSTWRANAEQVEITARIDMGPPAAAAIVAAGRGNALFDAVRNQIAQLQKVVSTRQDAVRAKVQHTYDRFVQLVFVTLGAVVAMAVASAILLARWLTRPVERLARSVEQVRDGDLDHEVEIAGPSELVEIGTAVEDMRSRLVQEIARTKSALVDAATANSELEAFSYSVSHDLRAPLRSIDGFSQAVLEDAGDQLDEVARAHFARIRAATQRMAELIDALLELSRVSRVEPVFTDVDITAMSRQVVDTLAAAEPTRTVDVTIQPGLRARADSSLVHIVLENLLGNAWKFTGEQPQPHVEVTGNDTAGHTVFKISDNGAGFDQAYADKLFSPFQRLHTDREFPGTGVGLATVARIVHRHGGEVCAEGTRGEGAAITFTLSAGPG